MEIYVIFLLFPYFFGFQSWFYHMQWCYPCRSFKQQLMTSQIRSHIEYLMQSYNILVLILRSKLMRNAAAVAFFLHDLMTILDSVLLFGATLYKRPAQRYNDAQQKIHVNQMRVNSTNSTRKTSFVCVPQMDGCWFNPVADCPPPPHPMDLRIFFQ